MMESFSRNKAVAIKVCTGDVAGENDVKRGCGSGSVDRIWIRPFTMDWIRIRLWAATRANGCFSAKICQVFAHYEESVMAFMKLESMHQ
jgi:hypothetical protein